MPDYVLEMKGIHKSFPGVRVLHDVHLQLRAGEVHALMGENGAGKSTLMKILMGIYTADAGEIVLDGRPVAFRNPREAMENGVAMIHQELNPILDMAVFENIFVGRELHHAMGIVDKRAMIRRTREIFNDIGISINPQAPMRSLSVAQCQLVEIVKAISVGAHVIIMDEPTSAITEAETQTLFAQIERLKKEGCAILYISHKMDEIFRICDRITVLRDGEWIGSDLAANMTPDQLIRMMVGREIDDVFPKTDVPLGEPLLTVSGLTWPPRVRDVSFTLHQGEILGFAGLVGAGRSEVAECLFGLHKGVSGSVSLRGKPVRFRSARDAIRSKIAFVTEDRKQTGLNLAGTVAQNITVVALNQLFRNGVIQAGTEARLSRDYIDRLKIKTPGHRQSVANLSGGNQQKVVLAKWLLTEPDIIILDEPTRGIDVGAKRDIYLLMGELVRQGKGVILISSEISELMGLCDRILVMHEGDLSGELQRPEFDQEVILHFASGLGGKA